MAIYVDEKELIAAYHAGDTGAFTELVNEYGPELVRHARRRLRC
jgi:DNA-directed RNA polymerase specialized sigma24 family protein